MDFTVGLEPYCILLCIQHEQLVSSLFGFRLFCPISSQVQVIAEQKKISEAVAKNAIPEFAARVRYVCDTD